MAALASSDPTLHVFEQEGEWHWGITIERSTGTGIKVVAFSEEGFGSEAEAREDGEYVLRAEDWQSKQRWRRSQHSKSRPPPERGLQRWS
jgi:hypothetical protein